MRLEQHPTSWLECVVGTKAIPSIAGALAAGLALAGPGGCAYDWEVVWGPEGGVSDVATISDSGWDGARGAVDASSCPDLTARVAAARDVARTCALASGQCTTTVKDACGCPVFIAVAGSTAATDYEAAIAAYRGAGCKPTCATCPALPTAGVCLDNASSQERCNP